jgi:hypothetical protein
MPVATEAPEDLLQVGARGKEWLLGMGGGGQGAGDLGALGVEAPCVLSGSQMQAFLAVATLVSWTCPGQGQGSIASQVCGMQ